MFESNTILEIIGISCFALLFVQVMAPLIKQRLDIAYNERIKPFDCEMCLSFWTAAGYFTFSDAGLSSVVLYASIASILAVFLTKQLR